MMMKIINANITTKIISLALLEIKSDDNAVKNNIIMNVTNNTEKNIKNNE